MASPLETKIRRHFDDLFAGVPPSQPLMDLKEERVSNLRERVLDLQARGLDEDQAFREAVISMGDLSGLVQDMRKIGQDRARQAVYTSMNNRLSSMGIVAGVILTLFGILNMLMIHQMGERREAVLGNGIFVVLGAMVLTYSLLTRETSKAYAMNRWRAGLYSVGIGLILFGLWVGMLAWVTTGRTFIGISSLMLFFLAGVGLVLFLVLTGTNRSKV